MYPQWIFFYLQWDSLTVKRVLFLLIEWKISYNRIQHKWKRAKQSKKKTKYQNNLPSMLRKFKITIERYSNTNLNGCNERDDYCIVYKFRVTSLWRILQKQQHFKVRKYLIFEDDFHFTKTLSESYTYLFRHTYLPPS